ncbi:hypothetical protein KSS87_004540, partial [Heliosperma pusillum]
IVPEHLNFGCFFFLNYLVYTNFVLPFTNFVIKQTHRQYRHFYYLLIFN